MPISRMAEDAVGGMVDGGNVPTMGRGVDGGKDVPIMGEGGDGGKVPTMDGGVDDGNVPTMGGETTATFPTAASYAHSSNIYLFLCEL